MAKKKKEVMETGREEIRSQRHIDIYRDENKNLKNISIDGLELNGYTFARLDLTGSSLTNSVFNKCKFQGLDFTKFETNGCLFKECEMKFALFPEGFWQDNKNENCSIR